MPTEPDNHIDGQLKAWAAARRNESDGPFELHPATRRMLQDEVARTFPESKTKNEEPSSEKSAGWLALLRPRLAFALSVVAAMVVIGIAIWPPLSGAKTKSKQLYADRGESERLARRSERLAELSFDQAAPTQATAPALGGSTQVQSADTARPASKGPESGEAVQVAEVRGRLFKNSLEPSPREDSSVPGKAVLADKTKEVALAKDESTLSKRDTARSEGKLAAEQFGLKPAEGAVPVVAQSAAGGRAFDSLGVSVAASATDARNKQPTPTAKTSSDGTVEDKMAWLASQKSQPASTPAAPAPVVEADRPQAVNAYAFESAANLQNTRQFVQLARYRRNFNSPPMPGVLASFQLEQNGRQLRIVDADGSVYEGEIGLAAASVQGAKEAEEQSILAFKKSTPTQNSINLGQANPVAGVVGGDQDSPFRVTGTNRTLNQLVIFTGNLGMASNLAPAANSTEQQRGAVQLFRQAAPASQAVSNSTQQNLPRVQGQATIGGDRIEINAVPAGP